MTKQQKTQQQAFQTVQDQNNEIFALLRDELRLTQESVERIEQDTYTNIIRICLKVCRLSKTRFDFINSKVPIATFFNHHNFICHK